MTQDFSSQNLRGRSFKGQNLTGADFSYADIRGVDFSRASLRAANFKGAKAGLQRRWAVGLVVVSLMLSAVSSVLSALSIYFVVLVPVSLILHKIQNSLYIITGAVYLIVLITSSILTIRRGVAAGIGTIAVTGVVAVVTIAVAGGVSVAGVRELAEAIAEVQAKGIGAIAEAGVMVITAAGCFAIFGAIVGAIVGVLAIPGIVGFAIAFSITKPEVITRVEVVAIGVGTAIAITRDGAIAAVGAGFFSAVIMLPNAYISWRALTGDEKHAFIRTIAIAFAATGGTSFRAADLTDADFSQAMLKNTDFRRATLTRTCWHGAEKLDCVRPGTSYLANAQLRHLLTTGQGQGQNFDHTDLRGVNLQGYSLAYASFIDTDLSQANLQEANLFEAKLIRTNLDEADLNNAHLTGAYIEDWGITRRTRLAFIECEYVYLKLPTDGNRDPNRMPSPKQGNFGANDFSIFITSILDTLDLYHKQEINSSVAITVLKGMTQKYPVHFELVGLENRGNKQFVIRLKVHGQTSYSQLQKEYYSKYEQILPMYDPNGMLPDTDAVVAQVIEAVNENPSTQIFNEGIVVAEGEVRMNFDQSRTQNINTGGGSINNSGAGAFSLGDSRGTVVNTTHNQGDTMSDRRSDIKFGNVGGDVSGLAGGDIKGVAGKDITGAAGGDISGTVTATIGQLQSSDTLEAPKLADLLKQLQTAIESDIDLSEDDKAEALEQVKALAEAGQSPQEGPMQKTAKTAMKILKGTVVSLPTAATLYEACNKLLPAIAQVFGL